MTYCITLPFASTRWGENGRLSCEQLTTLGLVSATFIGTYYGRQVWEISCTEEALTLLILQHGVILTPHKYVGVDY